MLDEENINKNLMKFTAYVDNIVGVKQQSRKLGIGENYELKIFKSVFIKGQRENWAINTNAQSMLYNYL